MLPLITVDWGVDARRISRRSWTPSGGAALLGGQRVQLYAVAWVRRPAVRRILAGFHLHGQFSIAIRARPRQQSRWQYPVRCAPGPVGACRSACAERGYPSAPSSNVQPPLTRSMRNAIPASDDAEEAALRFCSGQWAPQHEGVWCSAPVSRPTSKCWSGKSAHLEADGCQEDAVGTDCIMFIRFRHREIWFASAPEMKSVRPGSSVNSSVMFWSSFILAAHQSHGRKPWMLAQRSQSVFLTQPPGVIPGKTAKSSWCWERWLSWFRGPELC